jgi:hypothetical protein
MIRKSGSRFSEEIMLKQGNAPEDGDASLENIWLENIWLENIWLENIWLENIESLGPMAALVDRGRLRRCSLQIEA